MSRVLNLKERNKGAATPSTTTPMQPLSSSLKRDIFLTAISVIPAAILWIGFDQFYLAIVLATGTFLTAEYGYPAWKEGRLDFSPVLRYISQVRDLVRSRVVSGA